MTVSKEIDYKSIFMDLMKSKMDADDHKIIEQFKVFGDAPFYGAIADSWTGPEYFVTGNRHQYVCTIAHDETNLSVSIYSDGKMKYWDKYQKFIMRTRSDLYDNGFDTQDKLTLAISDEKIFIENNPWFDVYSSWNEISGESEECITHDLFDDAIPNAVICLVEKIRDLYHIKKIDGDHNIELVRVE